MITDVQISKDKDILCTQHKTLLLRTLYINTRYFIQTRKEDNSFIKQEKRTTVL